MSNESPDAAFPDDGAVTSDAGDLVGREFGHYRVISEIGRGGMATVYKADEQSLNRVVALKVMSRAISQDATMVKRFQREAQAAAQLSHPNIVQIYAIGAEQGINYFTMEYVKGKTLGELKRERGKLAPADLVPIMIQTAEALGEAHKHDVVHRDIKPSNIMLDAAGRVKVADFGIARVTSAHTQLTVDGSFLGTPQYMSPEQCDGTAIDGRSDIYSLGVTFYELVTGKIPFAGDSPASVLVKIVQGRMIPIQEAAPDLPPSVRAVIDKMMQRDRANRYQNADELVEALRKLRTALAGTTGQAVAVASPVATPTSGGAGFRLWGLPVAAVAAVVILIGLCVGAMARLWHTQRVWVAQAGAISAAPLAEDSPTPSLSSTLASAAAMSTMDLSPAQPVSMPAVAPDATALTPELADPAPLEPPVEVAAVPAAPANAMEAPPLATPPVDAPPAVTPPAETPPAATPPVPVALEAAPPAGSEVAVVVPAPAPPPPPPTAHAPPPENSLLITPTGNNSSLLLATHAEKLLRGTAYKTVQNAKPGVDAADVAEFQLTVDLADAGTTELHYLNRTSLLQHGVITLKLIRTGTGELVAGPLTQNVDYTGLTATAKFEEAMKKLIAELKQAVAE